MNMTWHFWRLWHTSELLIIYILQIIEIWNFHIDFHELLNWTLLLHLIAFCIVIIFTCGGVGVGLSFVKENVDWAKGSWGGSPSEVPLAWDFSGVGSAICGATFAIGRTPDKALVWLVGTEVVCLKTVLKTILYKILSVNNNYLHYYFSEGYNLDQQQDL